MQADAGIDDEVGLQRYSLDYSGSNLIDVKYMWNIFRNLVSK